VSVEAILILYLFLLAAFTGYEMITKVPTTLHTPLMSGSNAIHGIILVGAILVAGAIGGTLGAAIGFAAVFFATLNVVGGFVVTDRMLGMFQQRRPQRPPAEKK
jgi:NAD(P) transhydrogenase subunit alpha